MMNKTNSHNEQPAKQMDRRDFLRSSGGLLASSAMASMLPSNLFGATAATRGAKAKRVIHLFMAGGFSQLDTFDYKPGLADRFDQDLPDSIRKG